MLVFVILIGLVFGNYLTTFYSRAIEGKPFNGILQQGMKPHCDNCGTHLRYYEYWPVFSWVCSRFRCNYCGIKIPLIYFLLEMSGLIVAVLCFYLVGMSEYFVVAFLFCNAVIYIVAITYYKRYFN